MLPFIPLLGGGLVGAAVLVADPVDPLSGWPSYGILGLIILAIFTGWIVPGPTSKAKDAEIKRLLDENARLQQVVEEQLIPIAKDYAVATTENSRVMALALAALEGKT